MIDLTRANARLRETERMVGVGSWELIVADGTITYSAGFGGLLGLAPAESLNLDAFAEMVHPEDREILSGAVTECLTQGSVACEYRIIRRDGGVRTLCVQGEAVREDPEYLRGAVLDVTDDRAEQRERLAAISLFQEGFDAAPIGMVLIDAGNGRYVRVNTAMCKFLQRSRGELLGLTFEEVTHPDDRGLDLEGRRSLIDGVNPSFQIEKRYLRPDGSAVWASLHVTPVRDPDGSVQTFFAQVVDISERKEREVLLEDNLQDALWLARIRAALDEDRLVLYSQPIVDLLTGKTVQNELLLRMRDEDGSIILPGEFLPIAERYGLISEIDRWVIRQAVAIAAAGTPTEFNLSGRSLGDPSILRELESAIESSEVDPSLLVIEVTETAIVDQLEAGRNFADRVAALGLQLALDDFGTGYASLWYIRNIPAHYLKIDIEFVRDLARSDTDGRVIEGIVAFAQAFGQRTVAEGVEDEATLIRLRELGVDYAQGYFFARPAPCNGTDSAEALTLTPPAGDDDPIQTVREAFDAFSNRDIATMLERCHPDLLLRAPGTANGAGRGAIYRGHDGLRDYFRDLAAVWDDLTLTPSTFRQVKNSVILFGRAEGHSGDRRVVADVLWVWRLNGDFVSSVEAFMSDRKRSLAPPSGEGAGAGSAAAVPKTEITPPASQPAAPAPSPDLPRPGTPDADRRLADKMTSEYCRSFGQALRDGDPARAEAISEEALGHGLSVEQVYSGVIAPAMEWIGELWQHDEASIAGEHLATAISQGVMARLFPRLLHDEPRSRELVMLAATHGEQHVLGLRMMADTLEGAGFDVRYLGPDVPLEALLEACRKHRPAVLGLGAHMWLSVPTLIMEIEEVAKLEHAPLVFVGGRAVGEAAQNGLDALVVQDCEEVVRAVTSLLEDDAPYAPVRPELVARVPPRSESGGSIALAEEQSVAGSFSAAALAAAETARGAARDAFGMQRLAYRDGLTGLWNRRAYDDRLMALSEEADGSALMLDVDRFKAINDSHGHETGDRVLVAIGEAILASIRPMDFGARFGGDEFVVLFPGMEIAEATQVAERIRERIEAELGDPPVTVSIGVGHLSNDTRRTGLTIDRALYEAKAGGRNQVAQGEE